MKTILIVIAIVAVGFAWDSALHGKININGTIYHPIYGKYPAVVPFEQGMSIYPGQSAMGSVPLPPELEELERRGRELERKRKVKAVQS